MPSAKKNRGRQRKVARMKRKQATNTVEATTTADEVEAMEKEAAETRSAVTLGLRVDKGCAHGAPSLNEQHVVNKVLDLFIDEMANHAHALTAYDEIMRVFPLLIQHERTRSILISLFAVYGTEMVLGSEWKWGCAQGLAEAIFLFEHFHPTCESFPTKDHKTFRDLQGKNRSTILRVFKKRIVCSCLDDMYQEERKKAKIGVCSCCGNPAEFIVLLQCSGCGVNQYCNENCQRLH